MRPPARADLATLEALDPALVYSRRLPPLDLLIVEDDGDLRQSLARALGRAPQEVRVAAAVGSAAAARRALAGGLPVDVALVDLGLPDEPGSEVVAHLRRARPDAVAVAFTVHDDPPTVIGALRAGARGYLLKSASPAQLLAALRDARAGGAPMTPSIARLVVEEIARTPPRPEPDGALTERERQVLALLGRGHTYADAAHALGIGLGTLQTYVKAIYGKLEVASKAEAAVVAARRGLL
jgi:DNA-binding NarL/FixJ family response regulator